MQKQNSLQYMSNYTAKNSFSRYPSVTQIISYLLFVMQILLFYIVVQKHLEPHWKRTTILVIYSIIAAVHLIITLLISLSDPTDQFMINCINDPQHAKFSDLKELLYCQICKSFVNKSSRHCKICSRCVQNFDHHCIWINNCVGSKNYNVFIFLLLTSFSSMVAYIGSISTLWEQGAYGFYIVEMGFLWGSMLIVCIFVILIANLMLFHLYMKYLGLTTYEFIISNKGRKKVGLSKSSNKIQNNDGNRQMKMEEEEIEKTEQNLPHFYDKINANTNENTKVLKQSNEQQKSQLMQSEQDQPSQHDTNKSSDKGKSISSKYVIPYPQQLDRPSDSYNERAKNNKDNIFEQDSQGSQKDVSMRESVRFTQYFSQSKSLKLLMNSDAIRPQKLKKQHLFSSISEVNSKALKAKSLYMPVSPKRQK